MFLTPILNVLVEDPETTRSTIEIVFFPLCYQKTSRLIPYLSLFPYFLFILPYLPFVGITENLHADRIGKVYYLIPFLVGALADLIAKYAVKTSRLHLQCLTPLHSIYAYPCYEIVVGVSYCLVEIMYYWPSFVLYPTEYVRNVWYLSRRITLIAVIAPIAVMSYTATWQQSVLSVAFGFLTVPIFMCWVYVLESVWYSKWRQQIIDGLTSWWYPNDDYYHDDDDSDDGSLGWERDPFLRK
jgi:hypothetical protein